MRRRLLFTTDPIDEAALLRERHASPGSGAAVCFVGLVRGHEGGQPIRALHYEAFVAMAERQLQRLCEEVEKRWTVESIRVIHRLNEVQVGEAAVWVEVVAPHRAEAFAACQWLMDELKQRAPVWKKPVF